MCDPPGIVVAAADAARATHSRTALDGIVLAAAEVPGNSSIYFGLGGRVLNNKTPQLPPWPR
jgi:hypothetical protein